ncbi:MAG: pyruvate kinase [Bacilli bacterium]|nr:pyruvate kinase [Bacilli bacterium]
MKKTKIICSIGPSSVNPDIFLEMVNAGCNVARINFSHATIEERKQVVDTVNIVRNKTKKAIGILYDTKGPEFRNGNVKPGGINLVEGNFIKIVKDDVLGDEEKFSVNHQSAIDSLNVGNVILLENGLMKLEVTEKNQDYVNCKIITGGILESKKSLSVPGVKLDIPFISDVDYDDIVYACRNEGNFLALSFVSTKDEVLEVRKILEKENRTDLKIISKIESQTGIENLESIIEVSDGIMVARGDLGVEIPMEDLPIWQRKIANLCRRKGKICIVATEMLESMKKNIRPTRAEVTDIANAVYNGADAVMLSGETTTGLHPIEAVRYMSNICEHIEASNENKSIYEIDINEKSVEAIAESVVATANSLKAKLIVIPSITGTTATIVSNLEPNCPILTLTTNKDIAESLTLYYGIYPRVVDEYKVTEEVFTASRKNALEFMNLKENDIIIMTAGFKTDKESNIIPKTNLMKIEII